MDKATSPSRAERRALYTEPISPGPDRSAVPPKTAGPIVRSVAAGTASVVGVPGHGAKVPDRPSGEGSSPGDVAESAGEAGGPDTADTTDTPHSGGVGAQAARNGGRRRAAGIYGTIVTAAVLAAGGNQLSTWALAVTVVVTLVVYWLAEQYAELLAEHTHAGRLPSRDRVFDCLAEAWPMVTASYLPVSALLIAGLLGVSSVSAARVALGVATVLLVIYGHAAGRAAGLAGIRLVVVTGTAGVLGIALIVLKTLLQHHHY